MAFVVRGGVHAFLDELGDRSQATAAHDMPLPRRSLFKSMTVGQTLVSSLQTLSDLVAGCIDHRDTGFEALGYSTSPPITFIVVEDAELAVLTKEAFREEMGAQPHTLFHFVDAVLRRLYFSTLPIANRYLGLGEVIATFGKELLAKIVIPSDDQLVLRKGLDQLDRPKLLSVFEPFSSQELMRSQTSPDFNLPTPRKLRQQSVSTTSRPSGKENSLSELRLQIPEDNLIGQILSPPTSSLASALSRFEGVDFSIGSVFEHERSPSSLSGTVRRNTTSLLLRCLGLLSGSTSAVNTDQGPDAFQNEDRPDVGKLVFVPQGTKLVSQGKRYPAVCLLVDGQLRASVRSRGEERNSSVSVILCFITVAGLIPRVG